MTGTVIEKGHGAAPPGCGVVDSVTLEQHYVFHSIAIPPTRTLTVTSSNKLVA